MTIMALLQGAPSVLKTTSPFNARVNRSTALLPSGRRARSVSHFDHYASGGDYPYDRVWPHPPVNGKSADSA